MLNKRLAANYQHLTNQKGDRRPQHYVRKNLLHIRLGWPITSTSASPETAC